MELIGYLYADKNLISLLCLFKNINQIIMKEKDENDEKKHNQVKLTFIVNGTETIVEKVNVNQPLHVPVQKALEQTGNTGRQISEFQVIFNDQTLDPNIKVEDFNFPENAVIFLSLKAGQGGI